MDGAAFYAITPQEEDLQLHMNLSIRQIPGLLISA